MKSHSHTWQSLSPTSILAFIFVALAYAGVSALAQIEYPVKNSDVISPLEIALWLAIFAGLLGSFARLLVSDSRGVSEYHLLLLATGAIAAIFISESSDWFIESTHSSSSAVFQTIDATINALIAIGVTISLLVLEKLPRQQIWIVRCLQAIVIYQVFSFFSEATEISPVFGQAYATQLSFSTQLVELLCIEFFIIGLVLSQAASSQKAKLPKFLVKSDGTPSGLFVGFNARQVCEECNLIRSCRHPPLAIAFYPVFREATLFLVMFWLASTAGRSLKKATGKAITSQIGDMTRLWFKNGIDPPSYYAQNLFCTSRLRDVPHYLTRFETKNGLLGTLNKLTPNPFPISEMSDKAQFAECCSKNGIPHPTKLISVSRGTVEWHCQPEDLATSLFCKPQRGLGAEGTITFRYVSPGWYTDEDGHQTGLDGVIKVLKQSSSKIPMLVQPWLKNHAAISDLALDSLITIRVVTCINESGEPEVTLAMLRLLAKLEPQWQDLPDEEYAAPIDLISGEMGLFTGDNFKTSHLRYERHPVTDAPIKGRILADWDLIKQTAISVHAALSHRLIIGWDIALTDNGPVVLEGNSNLDVMFLQRVHDMPAGRTRFGELLNLHLKTLYHQKMSPERL